MADDNFVELIRATVNTLEDLLGGNEPNTQIYTVQCKVMVDDFVQVRNCLPTLLEGADGVCSAQIFKELYRLACGAVRILTLCCEEQKWLQAVILLKVHIRNGPKWSTFETLRDELNWCINILRGNIDASTSTRIHRVRVPIDRETLVKSDEVELRKKLNIVVKSENSQSEIASFLLARLDVSNGQPLDPNCRCIQKLNCWQPQYQETVPLIHLIESRSVVGPRVSSKDGKISSVSRDLTWFGITVAEKVFLRDDNIRKLYAEEAHIMATLTHPNVVSFIGCSNGVDGPAIIMECEDQSLQDYIDGLQAAEQLHRNLQTLAERRRRATPPLELVVAVDLLSQIASGMEYLHSQDVAHLDLKLANLLITSRTEYKFLQVKIADFGHSIRLKKGSGKIRNPFGANHGTTVYRAMELFHKDKRVCFRAADVCSFGFTAWAILHCHEPRLEKVSLAAPYYYNELVAGRRLRFDDTIPQELQDLVKRCWDTDPDIRPTFSDVNRFLESFKAKLLGSHVPLVPLQKKTSTLRSIIRLRSELWCLGSRQGKLDEQHEESV